MSPVYVLFRYIVLNNSFKFDTSITVFPCLLFFINIYINMHLNISSYITASCLICLTYTSQIATLLLFSIHVVCPCLLISQFKFSYFFIVFSGSNMLIDAQVICSATPDALYCSLSKAFSCSSGLKKTRMTTKSAIIVFFINSRTNYGHMTTYMWLNIDIFCFLRHQDISWTNANADLSSVSIFNHFPIIFLSMDFAF